MGFRNTVEFTSNKWDGLEEGRTGTPLGGHGNILSKRYEQLHTDNGKEKERAYLGDWVKSAIFDSHL